jgi:hypothetical protein
MAILVRLMKAAITTVLLDKMIRGVLISLAVKSMRRIVSPATISVLMALAAMLMPLIDSMMRGNPQPQKSKDQVIDIEDYSVD